MISEEVMLRRFYMQNPSYVGKDIEIVNDGDGYTQKEAANILWVTDKAVSKWECGKSFPDIYDVEVKSVS